MPLVLRGKPVEVPGVRSVSYLEDPSLRLRVPGVNGRRRRSGEQVVAVVLHTTRGIPGGSNRTAQRVAERPARPQELGARLTVQHWREGDRFAGAHVVLDADGAAYCCCDLVTEAAYHAGPANGASVGVEVVQQRDASIHRAQLDALPLLVGALCGLLGVPRRVRLPYRPPHGQQPLDEPGVWGHRDLTDNRGRGDPGDLLLQALADAGWERF